MDPLWALVTEAWWVAPAAAGVGAAGWLGVRGRRTASARRLEFAAARHRLREARTRAATARAETRIARAELVRVHAERDAARASPADLARAQLVVQRSQREARAAAAEVRVRRAHVSAARAARPRAASDPLPLERLLTAHDTVTARWMRYETDAAERLMHPSMTDAAEPLTAAYLTARAEAQRLRPASARARMTPAAFAAYRDAVAAADAALTAAESEALRRARTDGTLPPEPPDDRWGPLGRGLADALLSAGADAVARAAESLHRPRRES